MGAERRPGQLSAGCVPRLFPLRILGSALLQPVQVIANPHSAGGRGGRVLPQLERRMEEEGLEFSVARTEAPGHARSLARAAAEEGVGRLLVVGGDGTIHEVASGLLRGREAAHASSGAGLPAIAVLPVGTGNDFHRMVRSSKGIDAAVRLLREGVPRSFEVGVARWEGGQDSFVNLLGVGVDVEVLRWRPTFSRLPGLLQYLGALVGALGTYRAIPLHITLLDGKGESEVVEAPVLLSALTVGPSIGGGFLLSPEARPDDGLLDLFLVEKLGLLKVARYLPGVLRGRLGNRPEVHRKQVAALRIRTSDDRPFFFELDGEVMTEETHFLDVEVRPGQLRILELPAGSRD